ncbi:arsenate reductase [Idiomarina sp. X4]|uniref:Spx/MgsR family RNA polymerase-binding regulatory protein n=1 Tax=unclassified Idiomarina TaxID=2614829 RepID=UPI000C291322|nr:MULTISPECIES: Spx/MgsR family RNA polymerase-binding regulatory protein [unclassified Idiomarina]ATZ74206.1 arsenate reductase [Idiomarina sp. X4]RXS44572.1 Spx/MgsR family RNA polymerase-binding regulatory protein [Idiomarina sp. 29L]
MLTIYGIKNCDTVKKSLKWLDKHSVNYQFIDVREQPLQKETVLNWLSELPADRLINKRSTSWRNLSDDQKTLSNHDALAELVAEQPTLFKRPLVKDNEGYHCGFKETEWSDRYL